MVLTGLGLYLAFMAYIVIAAIAVVVMLFRLWLRAPEDRASCRPHVAGAVGMLIVTVLFGVVAFIMVDTHSYGGTTHRFIRLLEDDGWILAFLPIMAVVWALTARMFMPR